MPQNDQQAVAWYRGQPSGDSPRRRRNWSGCTSRGGVGRRMISGDERFLADLQRKALARHEVTITSPPVSFGRILQAVARVTGHSPRSVGTSRPAAGSGGGACFP